MIIGQAIELLKAGHLVRRQTWDDNNVFVFMQIPAVISADIVPKMQSLPQTAKDYFQLQFDDEKAQINSITYMNQFAIVHKSNLIEGWAPSVADVCATDWQIYNPSGLKTLTEKKLSDAR